MDGSTSFSGNYATGGGGNKRIYHVPTSSISLSFVDEWGTDKHGGHQISVPIGTIEQCSVVQNSVV